LIDGILWDFHQTEAFFQEGQNIAEILMKSHLLRYMEVRYE
jgi:hypothetical protein